MMEVKDQGIKLFGKKIALPEDGNFPVFSGDDAGGDDSGAVSNEDSSIDRELGLMETNDTCLADKKVNRVVKEGQQEEEQTEKDHLAEERSRTKPEDKTKNSKASPESDDNPKTPSTGEDSATLIPPKTENDQTDTTKTLKKPDKILPCPRCNSMDTKFCYYNNYNVNQPRHFCKSCQRYWTAGGTMRNVLVGAGRRKNKNSTSNCSHLTFSEALQGAQIEPPNGPHHPTFKTNGTVLSFNSDPQKNSQNGTRNGDDCSSGSFVTASTSTVESVENGFPSRVPCIPWPYPWSSSVPVPIPSGVLIPLYPAPYWSYNVPGSWSINPWLSSPSTPNQKEAVAVASGQYSSTLGKHSREGELLKPSNVEVKEPLEWKNPESSILVPKTLRIDDPDEAAKSSIWETLGIKNDCIISRGGLFKAFERKGDEKNHVKTAASPVLQANPAAMSRSLSFQERA